VKKRVVLALAVTFLIGIPWAGLCGETTSGPSSVEDPAVSDNAGGPCRTLAAILRVYPALEVRTSGGSVRDAGNESEPPGCRVHASGPTSAIAGEVAPDEAVRQLLEQGGWKEDPNYSADGAGTTSFALRKGGVLCLVSAGAPSGFEDGKFFTDDIYELDARCGAESER
jgi:hypothetical protein